MQTGYAWHWEGGSWFDWSRARKEPKRGESWVLNGLVYHMSGSSLYNKDALTLAVQRGEIMHIITKGHIHHHEVLDINAYNTGLSASERKFNKHSPCAVELKPGNSKQQWKQACEGPPGGGIPSVRGPALRTTDPLVSEGSLLFHRGPSHPPRSAVGPVSAGTKRWVFFQRPAESGVRDCVCMCVG